MPVSKAMSTTTPSSGAARSISVGELEPFVRDLEQLDRDLFVLGVQAGPVPLARPALAEFPADDLGALVVKQNDRPVAAVDVALHQPLPPGPEGSILRDTALED